MGRPNCKFPFYFHATHITTLPFTEGFSGNANCPPSSLPGICQWQGQRNQGYSPIDCGHGSDAIIYRCTNQPRYSKSPIISICTTAHCPLDVSSAILLRILPRDSLAVREHTGSTMPSQYLRENPRSRRCSSVNKSLGEADSVEIREKQGKKGGLRDHEFSVAN